MPYQKLDRRKLTRALRRLGDLAAETHTTLEVSLYGGAVFTLLYASRDTTRDVDAVIHPSHVAKTLALQVAQEQALPNDWLNDNVMQFLSERGELRRLNTTEFGAALKISVPTAAYLLAMKLRAARLPMPGYPGDRDDIRFLVSKMRIRSVEAAEAIYDRFFPHDILTEEAVNELTQAIALGNNDSSMAHDS